MRPLRPSLLVAVALTVAAHARVAAAQSDVAVPRSWHGAGRVELGAEHDTNPARIEEVAGQPSERRAPASPAGRAVIAGDVAGRAGDRVSFALSASTAARAFTRSAARDESVAIVQGSGMLSLRLAEALSLSLATSYYDAFQKRIPTARDFRSLAPSLRLDTTFGAARAFVGGGHRWFTYKTERAYDFVAPTALVGVRVALTGAGEEDFDRPEWDLTVHASWEGRTFNSQRCSVVTGDPSSDPSSDPSQTIECTGGDRRDQFVATAVEVTRTTSWLGGIGVAGHVNASNSYGQTLQRLLVHARLGVLLPGDVSLSTRAELVLTRYEEGLSLGTPTGRMFVSLEDESRSTARVELARSIGQSFEAAARWTFFTSAPASREVSYDRHLFLLTLAWLL